MPRRTKPIWEIGTQSDAFDEANAARVVRDRARPN
jgi:hypothetical protein